MVIDWDRLPQAPGMRPGATRQAVAAERLSAVKVVTAPDATFDGRLHRHIHEQLLVVQTGEVTLQIGDDTVVARAHDVVFFPSGVRHSAIGVGREGCVYLEIFSPPRPDQLPGYLGPSPLEYA